MPQMVKIVNRSEEDFVDRYDGQTYRVKPGESLQVPAGAGYLWFGDPVLLSNPETTDKERARVEARRAPLPTGVYMEEVPEEPEVAEEPRRKSRRTVPKEIEEMAFAELEKIKAEEPKPQKKGEKA